MAKPAAICARYDASTDEFRQCPTAIARVADHAFAAWLKTTPYRTRAELVSAGVHGAQLGDPTLFQAAKDAAATERSAYLPRGSGG